jgi:transposase
MADLVRRRRQLIAMIVAEKSRLDTASPIVRRDIQSLVQLLERRVARSTSGSIERSQTTRRSLSSGHAYRRLPAWVRALREL